MDPTKGGGGGGGGYCHGPPSPYLGDLVAAQAAAASAAAASSSTLVNKSKGHHHHQQQQQQQQQPLSSGNYINVVPMPVGVQYHHRRKYSPQIPSDYQSRIFFGSEYMTRDRCRGDDFYPIASTPLPITDGGGGDSLTMGGNTSSNITTGAIINSSNPHHHPHHHQQPQHHQPAPSAIQQTQPQHQPHLQHRAVSPVPNVSSVLYTVQRVVTTAQIQSTTAVGGGNGSMGLNATQAATATLAHQSTTTSSSSMVYAQSNSSGTASAPHGGGSSGFGTVGASAVLGCSLRGTDANSGDCSAGLQIPSGSTTTTAYQTPSASNSFPDHPATLNYMSTTSHYTNNAAAAAAAAAASAAHRPLQNVIPTCVYLMSRIAVHMEIDGTAQCPAQVMLAAALGCEELGIANKLLAQSVFGLWMSSPLLEVQLKPHNRPFSVRLSWPRLLEKHTHGTAMQRKYDEPMVGLRRSAYFSKKDEEKIKDPRIIELLYEEARHNVLAGRYIMEAAHSIMLGGIQARIELGPYNAHSHSVGFFRENQARFLPAHVARNASWSWLPISRRTSAEVRLLEQFKRVPTSATTRKLMRKYLEFCWALPFYGAAFFHGQVEQPVRGLMSLVSHKDIPVLIGINEKGVFIIDHYESTLLLGLRYEELSWDFAKPSTTDDLDCLPCIFIQFDAVENGIAITKLMQIFSRQAPMMDALLSFFAEQMRRRRVGFDGQPPEYIGPDEPNPIQNNGVGVLSNKLSRLTLATFDDEGRCIGQTGSLSISF